MASSRPFEAFLGLPSGHAHGALRAGLMAMNVIPQPLEPDMRPMLAQLRALENDTRRVAFVDISAQRPSLIELDHALPRGPSRARVFLTRFTAGHVSDADHRWVQQLGFGGLFTGFAFDAGNLGNPGHPGNPDEHAAEPHLHRVLDRAAAALGTHAPAPDATTTRAVHARKPHDHPAREQLRRLTGTGAEAAAATLAKRLRIRDRQHRLRTYPACFVGRSAVRAIASTFDCSNHGALEIGRALHALGLLVHVSHDHDFEDDEFFYRLAVSKRADGVDLGDALRVLLDAMVVEDRSWHAKNYPRCWIGAEAVDLFMGRFTLERHHAWIVLHRLMQAGAFDHVVSERPFIDGHFFYRFAPVLDKVLVARERRDAAPSQTPLLPTW